MYLNFLVSSQLYALVYICYTYLCGFPIYSNVYVCYFERYICFVFLKFDQRVSCLHLTISLLCLCLHIPLQCNEMRSVGICSPYVHYMIFSESCLEDKSSGNI